MNQYDTILRRGVCLIVKIPLIREEEQNNAVMDARVEEIVITEAKKEETRSKKEKNQQGRCKIF